MGKMRNGNCGTTVIGPQVRPRDRRYSAVYRTPRVAGAAVNCVMRMWKVAFCACYRNLNLPSQEQRSATCHTVFYSVFYMYFLNVHNGQQKRNVIFKNERKVVKCLNAFIPRFTRLCQCGRPVSYTHLTLPTIYSV